MSKELCDSHLFLHTEMARSTTFNSSVFCFEVEIILGNSMQPKRKIHSGSSAIKAWRQLC
jgi:hypothetical protein